MKHIKYFEEKAIYDSYINGDDPILPNVSYVGDVNEVFYNLPNNNSTKNYMYVEALEDGLSVQFNQLMSANANSLEYSTDQKIWKTTANGVPTDTINVGEKLYFRGDVTNMDISFDNSGSIAGIGTFIFNKKCNVGGNIMSLLYVDDFEDKYDLSEYDSVFTFLFADINQTGMLIHSDKLILPAKILSPFCYACIFGGCTSLISTPELLATELAEYCYCQMFTSCTSLTTSPILPATKLADYCYDSMFAGCTSLTTAPSILPAIELARACYQAMFRECTSLITTPQLPATKLAEYCYASMFYECISLTTAPSILPATTLADGCYGSMFEGCTSLTTAPELLATTLVEYCYYYMFRGCTSLNYIKMLATDNSARNDLSNWVNGVSPTGTFVKHPDMTTLSTGISGIPSGWEVVDYNVAS